MGEKAQIGPAQMAIAAVVIVVLLGGLYWFFFMRSVGKDPTKMPGSPMSGQPYQPQGYGNPQQGPQGVPSGQ
jgi:hypothetical protein